MRRHHTSQAVNPESPPESQRGPRTLSTPYPFGECGTYIFIELGDNRTNTAQGTQHRQNAALGQQPPHPKPGYPKSASFPNDKTGEPPNVVQMRRLAEGIRGMKIRKKPRPRDSRTSDEVGQEFSDEGEEEEEEEEEMDDDRTYATEDGSSTQRSASMNGKHTPTSPLPTPSSAGINLGASETLEASVPQAMGIQAHQHGAQTWYNGPVWTNNSYNTTTNDTRDSHNDSSLNVVDSE